MREKNNRGITLIALVVTIIILLILAGVSINLVFDANGLFGKANDAASRYNQAKNEESDYLNSAVNTIDQYYDKYKKDDDPYVDDNTKKTAPDGDYYIPDGFKEADDSGDTIQEGKVVEDKKGNQYVWIPAHVENGVISSTEFAVEYQKTNFGDAYNEDEYDNYTEDIDPNDIESIKKYGGFYIGRYETGNDGDDNPVIKRNQTPYTDIEYSVCETLANGFGTNNEYNLEKMYTKIASSFAWDTSLCFIQKSFPTYPTNSSQGKYNSTSFQNTGLSEKVCNVYDMGGNIREYTSERYNDTYWPYVDRGGDYALASTEKPAGYRAHYDGDAYGNYGFRETLFLQ